MHIELETPDRLKIELSGAELKRLDLTYEQLDYGDERTRRVLTGLLQELGEPVGFDRAGARLMIEVFPAPAQGCVLYFTALRGSPLRESGQSCRRLRLRRPGAEPCVYEFADSTALLDAVSRLRQTRAGVPAALYRLGERYRLILRLPESGRTAKLLLGEYGKLRGRGRAAAAYTREHGRLLCRDAVAEIGRFLS